MPPPACHLSSPALAVAGRKTVRRLLAATGGLRLARGHDVALVAIPESHPFANDDQVCLPGFSHPVARREIDPILADLTTVHDSRQPAVGLLLLTRTLTRLRGAVTGRSSRNAQKQNATREKNPHGMSVNTAKIPVNPQSRRVRPLPAGTRRDRPIRNGSSRYAYLL